eukprot:m.220057 g.220057  ORF g.220057 m.220057 type:complete len:408 (-) comp15591_c1_seq2:4140-5363(-)
MVKTQVVPIERNSEMFRKKHVDDKHHVNTNAQESPEMREHPDIDQVKGWFWIPGLAFVTDLLVYAPTPAMIERTLQILILIVALLMSAIGGTATSTTFDEVQAAMKRVALVNDTSWSFCHGLDTSGEPTTMGNEVRQYCDLVVRQKSSCAKANGLFPTTITNGYFLSNNFGQECYGWSQRGLVRGGGTDFLVESVNLLAFSLFGLMMLYLGLVSTSFKSKTGKYSPAMMMSWWKCAVIPLLVCVIFLIYGSIKYFQFLWVMMMIKFPNPVVEISTGTGGSRTDTGRAMYNFSTEYGRWAGVGIPLVTLGILVAVSYASVLKAGTYVREKKALERAVENMDPQLLKFLEEAGVRECADLFCEADISYASLEALREDKAVVLMCLKEIGLSVGDQLKVLAELVHAHDEK